MHDDNADLHSFLSEGVALIHPHSAQGYGFLLTTFGPAVMCEYELYDESPRIAAERLPNILRVARSKGLEVQETLDSRYFNEMGERR